MAKFNGTDFKLFIDTPGTTGGGTPTNLDIEFDEQSELSIEVSAATIDYTSKDSGGWAENGYGLRSWSGSCTLIVDFQEATKKQWKDLMIAINTRAFLSVIARKQTEATGDVGVSGSIKIDSASLSAPMDDKMTVSFSFTGTGALTSTVAIL